MYAIIIHTGSDNQLKEPDIYHVSDYALIQASIDMTCRKCAPEDKCTLVFNGDRGREEIMEHGVCIGFIQPVRVETCPVHL